MVKKKAPPASQPTQPGLAEDAFSTRILELVAWTRQRAQLVTGGLVVLTILVVGIVYYLRQQNAHLELAAMELESAQVAAMFQPPEQAQEEIRAYIARFRDTPFALEAYLVLGELQLRSGQADRAVTSLLEVAPSYESPLYVQATFLLAVAYEAAQRWSDAATTYEGLLSRAPYTFQKREAGQGLARAHLSQGNLSGAVSAYEGVLATLESGHPDRALFEMRLAEIQAQL